MWPFRKKPEPTKDWRDWNEDWKVGDTAECIVDGSNVTWNDSVQPWHRPSFGQRLTVSGFIEGMATGAPVLSYFLKFSDWPVTIATAGFRKVRPVASEKSGIVERILNATPGQDRLVETS